MSTNKPAEMEILTGKAGEVDLEDSSRRVSVYSNLASASATAEECILRFGERTSSDSNKGVELATVYLSLGHAKRFVVAMAQVLQTHEELFGEIVADISAKLTPQGRKKLGIKEPEERGTTK